jgi:hypothetical protein
MDHSPISATPTVNSRGSLAKPYDWTIVPTVACMLLGVTVAIYAVAVYGPINAGALATMVAAP